MSFISGLKKAFGFGDSEFEESELEGVDARVTPLRERMEAESAAVASPGEVAGSGTASASMAPVPEVPATGVDMSASMVPDEIFESVVRIFNESLPAFLSESVDEKKQREYLYNALNSSMKSYIDGLHTMAIQQCSDMYETERRNLHSEMESLRVKARQEESENSEVKKLQLSAERQKRALSEKVHELEKQIATIQAENEQFQLENKSLLNKLRVSAVTAIPTSEDTFAPASAADGEAVAALNKTIEALTADNEALKTEKESLKAEKEALVAEAAVYQTQMQQFAGKIAALEAALEAAERAAKENLIALDASRRKATSLQEQLDEANENLKVVEHLNTRMGELEEARRANDAAQLQQKDLIFQQKEALSALEIEKKELLETITLKDNTIRTLEDQAGSLRKTIENNLYEHARAESVLREEIERLNSRRYNMPAETKSEAAEEPAEPVAENIPEVNIPEPIQEETKPAKRRGRKPKVRISAIDDSITDTEWLVAELPNKVTARKDAPDEFGYREPERKPPHEHPAQMSLWDD